MTSERKKTKPIRKQLELKRKSNRKSDESGHSFFGFSFFCSFFVVTAFCKRTSTNREVNILEGQNREFKTLDRRTPMRSVTLKMAGYWSRSFSRLYGSRRTQDVNKKAEKKKRDRKRPISSNLDRPNLVKKRLSEKDGKKAGLRRAHLARPGSQSEEHRIWLIFPASGLSHIL